jgi:hypothetical protein
MTPNKLHTLNTAARMKEILAVFWILLGFFLVQALMK